MGHWAAGRAWRRPRGLADGNVTARSGTPTHVEEETDAQQGAGGWSGTSQWKLWKEEKCREREEPKREALQREAQPPVLIRDPPAPAPASHPSAIPMPREQFCLHVGAPAFSEVALNPVLFCYLYHCLK